MSIPYFVYTYITCIGVNKFGDVIGLHGSFPIYHHVAVPSLDMEVYVHTKLGVARLIVFEGRWGMHD